MEQRSYHAYVYYNERVITHHNTNKLFAGLHFIMLVSRMRTGLRKVRYVLVHWSSPIRKLVTTIHTSLMLLCDAYELLILVPLNNEHLYIFCKPD